MLRLYQALQAWLDVVTTPVVSRQDKDKHRMTSITVRGKNFYCVFCGQNIFSFDWTMACLYQQHPSNDSDIMDKTGSKDVTQAKYRAS